MCSCWAQNYRDNVLGDGIGYLFLKIADSKLPDKIKAWLYCLEGEA